jgi:hypothetical protein
VRIDGDGQHFGNDAAIEALDHAIGLPAYQPIDPLYYR